MNYYLMNKRTPVAEVFIDEQSALITKVIEDIDAEHIPFGLSIQYGILDKKMLNDWWRGRAIPTSRDGIQDALDSMQIDCPEQLMLKSLGLSLSDQYWVTPTSNPMQWDRINFFQNAFSDDMGNRLFGKIQVSETLDLMSPSSTVDGWLKKKWKIIDGDRYLLKAGSVPYQQEPINEVIATALHRRLDQGNYVSYRAIWEEDNPLSMCGNFITPETEFVNAYHIMLSVKKPNHISNYDHFLSTCEQHHIPGMSSFVDYVLVTDYILANTDRHMGNFGAIRNVDTLEWVGAAPVFDSGTSLWHDRLASMINPTKDVASRPFQNTHSKQIQLVKSFDWLDFKALSGFEEEVREIFSKSPYMEDSRKDAICTAVKQRIQDIAKEATK